MFIICIYTLILVFIFEQSIFILIKYILFVCSNVMVFTLEQISVHTYTVMCSYSHNEK